MKERIALDLGNWKNKSDPQKESDFAAYLIENKVAPLDERITYYELRVDHQGHLISEEFGRVSELIQVNSELDNKELQATLNLEIWASRKDSQKGLSLWISPPSCVYTDSRFVIFEKNDDRIRCRAVCGKETKEECINIANKLSDKIYLDTEVLRSEIIEIKDEGIINNWIDSLEQVFGKSQVWDRIREGKDIEEKQITTKIASEIVNKYSRELRMVNNYYRQILLGAIIEHEAKSYGYQINPSGSCGISNITALGMGSDQSFTPFDSFFKGNWSTEKYFSCPRCQGKIPSGFGITVCPHCGARKDSYRTCD